MNIEEIERLIEEIDVDEYGNGYIDCSTATDYSDDKLYTRIVAAVKQSLELHKKNDELTNKLEEVEKQGMESLLKIECLLKNQLETANTFNSLLHGVQEHLLEIYAGKENDVRIGDYMFHVRGDHIDFMYEPIPKVEPIKLEIEVVENDNDELCPICNKELGQYPALSRQDNKTKICSECGMKEALQSFIKHTEENQNNESQSI